MEFLFKLLNKMDENLFLRAVIDSCGDHAPPRNYSDLAFARGETAPARTRIF
jgi:hypothetical protein